MHSTEEHNVSTTKSNSNYSTVASDDYERHCKSFNEEKKIVNCMLIDYAVKIFFCH